MPRNTPNDYPVSDDVVVLGEGIQRRDRTLKSGAVKSRYTIEVKSERLVFGLSPKALSKEPAQAALELLKERIEGISQTAAPNTIRARKTAARAFALGKAWAVKRYGGGRTGDTPPNTSDRLFNDSGRLASTLSARGNSDGDGWTINVAANRLSPGTLDGRGVRGGEAALASVWERLQSLIPELADMDAMADSIPVQLALRKAVDESVTKADSEAGDLVLELMEKLVEAAVSVDEMIAG